MLRVESSIKINAPRDRVFQLLSHPELMVDHMESVKSVDVISRGADSVLTETVAGTDGRDTTFVLESTFFPPERIETRQIKGELRSLASRDIISDVEGGTIVTETVDFDLGVPLFGNLLGRMGISQKIQEQVDERLAVLKQLAEAEASGN